MIPVAKPYLGEEEAAAVRRPILSGWVTQGPEVAAFEKEFATHVDAPHACAVANCTAALHLALIALGVGPGHEVITPSHTFIATANAIRHTGAEPVFVDIEPRTFNIDPDLIEAAVTGRTRAIMVVHQIGMPADLARIIPLAERLGLPVVEDAACAVGSRIKYNGRWEAIGRPHGRVACFSFHPRKVLTTGDGGMLTTSDAKLDARFRLLRQHSMSVPDAVRHGSKKVIFESYPETGWNYRLTDIQAAVGRVQLARLEEMVERRRRQAAHYSELLAGEAGVRTPFEPDWARTNWQSYCVRLTDDAPDQKAVMQRLLDAGVSTRPGVMCCHTEAAYSGAGPFHLPHSEAARERTIILPLFHELTEADQEEVVRQLKTALAGEA